MTPRTLRPQTCSVCGSTKITAAYDSDDVIYLACDHCQTLRAIEKRVSDWRDDAPADRPKTKHPGDEFIH